MWFEAKTKMQENNVNLHHAHSLALYDAGCFVPMVRLVHRAVMEAEEIGPEMSATSFEGNMLANRENIVPSTKALEECNRFAFETMSASYLSFRHEDCARALMAGPELDTSNPHYPQVVRALRAICTRDDIFDQRTILVTTMCVYTMYQSQLKLGHNGARSFQKYVVKPVYEHNPGLWKTALQMLKVDDDISIEGCIQAQASVKSV